MARIAMPNALSQPVLKKDLIKASQIMKTIIGPKSAPRNAVSIIENRLITITPTRVSPRALPYVALLPAATLAAKKIARAVINQTIIPTINKLTKPISCSINIVVKMLVKIFRLNQVHKNISTHSNLSINVHGFLFEMLSIK